MEQSKASQAIRDILETGPKSLVELIRLCEDRGISPEEFWHAVVREIDLCAIKTGKESAKETKWTLPEFRLPVNLVPSGHQEPPKKRASRSKKANLTNGLHGLL